MTVSNAQNTVVSARPHAIALSRMLFTTQEPAHTGLPMQAHQSRDIEDLEKDPSS